MSVVPELGQFELGDIYLATMGCISNLEACLPVKRLMKESWAESRLADMKLWASGVGALAGPEASLERRLQFQPKPRLVLINLLLTLQEFVRICRLHALDETHGETVDGQPEPEGKSVSLTDETLESTLDEDSDLEPSSAPWFIALNSGLKTNSDAYTDSDVGDESDEEHSRGTLEKLMKNTEDILDQLMMLGFAIRKSGTAARLQKADDTFESCKNKYRHLRSHLEFILLHATAKRQQNQEANKGITAEEKIREVRDNFGEVTPEQRHLVLANLWRRHRFEYARRHQQKLDQVIRRPAVPKLEPAVHTTEMQKTAVLENSHQRLDERKPPTKDSPSTIQSSAPPRDISHTQVMSETAPSAPQGDILKMSLPLQAAASRVSVSVATMHYPSPPSIAKQVRGFKCPCCCQTLPEMFRDWSRWRYVAARMPLLEIHFFRKPVNRCRKHLTEDLCPYTCPFIECPTPKVLYISRTAWRDHILGTHSTGQYWECLACAGTEIPDTFSTAEEFDNHNRSQHQDTISEDQIRYLRDSCRKIGLPNISLCPLCPWPQNEDVVPDAAANLEHVGNCIHEFSLNALPWANSSHVGAGLPNPDLRQKVEEWFERAKDSTTKGVDIQKIHIEEFGVLPVAPPPEKQETAYIPEEYFAESAKESSQVERESPSSDSDLPDIDGTNSDYISDNDSVESVEDRIVGSSQGVSEPNFLSPYASG